MKLKLNGIALKRPQNATNNAEKSRSKSFIPLSFYCSERSLHSHTGLLYTLCDGRECQEFKCSRLPRSWRYLCLGKEGLITELTQESSNYFLFVLYRYDNIHAAVNVKESRCNGSKATVKGDHVAQASATIPNVNIEQCNYTIALWTRYDRPLVTIYGSSRSGKFLGLISVGSYIGICGEDDSKIKTTDDSKIKTSCVSGVSGVTMKTWTHIVVTCEQDNRLKMFFNGEMANSGGLPNVIFFEKSVRPPRETLRIDYEHSLLIMDLLILGFPLPPDQIYDLYRGQQIV